MRFWNRRLPDGHRICTQTLISNHLTVICGFFMDLRKLKTLIDLVAVALFALAIRGIVRDVKLYKAAKAARAENKNA